MHQYSWHHLYDYLIEETDEKDSSSNNDDESFVVKNKDGIFCSKCRDFFHWAEANQPDGKTFVCRDCKLNPWRSSPIYPDD